MADEIRQQLTFDASSAIAELGKLNKALIDSRAALKTFGSDVSKFNRSASSFVGSLNRMSTSAATLKNTLAGGLIGRQTTAGLQQATGLVDQFGNSLTAQGAKAAATSTANKTVATTTATAGNAASVAQPKVAGLSVSFGTLARIIATQLTVRAFAGFIQGLRDSTSSAIEFQKSIAEIQSIAQGSLQDLITSRRLCGVSLMHSTNLLAKSKKVCIRLSRTRLLGHQIKF